MRFSSTTPKCLWTLLGWMGVALAGPALSHDPNAFDLTKPYVAPGFEFETLFEGGAYVGLAVHGERIYVGEKQSGSQFGGSVGRLRLVDPEAAAAALAPTMTDLTEPMAGETMEAFGERVYSEKDCWNCHSTDGTRRRGPTFKGLWGSEVHLADGSTVIATGPYIRECCSSQRKTHQSHS